MEKCKKIVILAVVFCLVLASCATKKNDAADIPDAVFQKEYTEHAPDLILDGAKTYKVKWGDTLSKIAKKYYGPKPKSFYFPLIMLASSDVVKNPDLISSGMVLTIPDLNKNLADPKARANIKSLLLHIADIYKDAKKYPKTQEGLISLSNSLK